MSALVSGVETAGIRWNQVVERSRAGSIHQAELPFVDAGLSTGSISGAGVVAPGVGTVALRGKAVVEETPDEDRVTRSDKRGRIVRIAPVAPPKAFNAGSVLERTSSLMSPEVDEELRMAFVAPDEIKGREIQVAQAFHVRQEKKAIPGVPEYLVALVNNDKPDILATAYAPPKPDFAVASPFASLLKEEDPNGGRFVPPMGKNDHQWLSRPLPASAFSGPEQKCLAEGIYFEARGESVEGQAAVAQVILNRVRNPAYPNTICGVVYQNKDWRNRCQFSFACEGKKLRIASPRHFEMAKEIAMAVTAGKIFLNDVGSATHYYATYVRPAWARRMNRTDKIGLHVFYRTKNGGWD